MKKGTRSVPPSFEAKATCGFTAGLVPPMAGWLWQPAQPSRFIRGPTPSGTSSTLSKSALPSAKNSNCLAVNPASGAPAPAAPPRTPGSRATLNGLWARAPPPLRTAETMTVRYIQRFNVKKSIRMSPCKNDEGMNDQVMKDECVGSGEKRLRDAADQKRRRARFNQGHDDDVERYKGKSVGSDRLKHSPSSFLCLARETDGRV